MFTPGLAGLVLGEFRRLAASPAPGRARAAPQLTERETEVLRLVAKGLSYKQIAERLVLSHRTVQNHVQNTLGKLQLHNRVELVRYAIEHGLDQSAGADYSGGLHSCGRGGLPGRRARRAAPPAAPASHATLSTRRLPVPTPCSGSTSRPTSRPGTSPSWPWS